MLMLKIQKNIVLKNVSVQKRLQKNCVKIISVKTFKKSLRKISVKNMKITEQI